MKKIIIIAIAIISVFALCACDNNSKKTDMLPENVKSITISMVDGKTYNFYGETVEISENNEYIIVRGERSIYLIEKDNICILDYTV